MGGAATVGEGGEGRDWKHRVPVSLPWASGAILSPLLNTYNLAEQLRISPTGPSESQALLRLLQTLISGEGCQLGRPPPPFYNLRSEQRRKFNSEL